jgi:hypothetical protein
MGPNRPPLTIGQFVYSKSTWPRMASGPLNLRDAEEIEKTGSLLRMLNPLTDPRNTPVIEMSWSP